MPRGSQDVFRFPLVPGHRLRWNKVPEVTVYFWVIKVLCTTVGETAADLLNEKAGLGLTGVSLLMSALLAVVLVVQFRTTAYRPGVYCTAVALISVVGTLVSDNLGVPLETTTAVFAVLLTVVSPRLWDAAMFVPQSNFDTELGDHQYWRRVLTPRFTGPGLGAQREPPSPCLTG